MMMEIERIRSVTRLGRLFYTDHAVRRMAERGIDEQEVRQTILNGEIVEEYPDDRYSPSCLIYGRTDRGRRLHVQCTMPPRARIITTYEPDPHQWIDFRQRKES